MSTHAHRPRTKPSAPRPSYSASGISAGPGRLDPVEQLRILSHQARDTELELRTEIARLERECHRLAGELARESMRHAPDLPAGSTRGAPPVTRESFGLAPFPRRRPK